MISNRLLIKIDELLGRKCQITTTQTKFPSWQNRPFYLFISLKNRKFNKLYISWFIDLCETYHQIGKICIVDEPYLFNRMAELGVDHLQENERRKIEQISWEIERKVSKTINSSGSTQATIISWKELTAQTPQWINSSSKS